MITSVRLPLVACCLLAAAAARAGPDDRAQLTGAFFVGATDCAGCEPLRERLYLHAARAFVLETMRPGDADPLAVLGVWSESANGTTLELRRVGEPSLLFAIGRDKLRPLDGEGHPAKRAPELVRAAATRDFRPRLRLDGSWEHTADGALLRECASRAPLAILPGEDAAALAQAAVDAAGGGDVLVSIEARFVPPAPAHPGWGDGLVVERFIGAWPGESCGDPFADVALTGTYWVLTRLEDRPVARPQRGLGAHLVLDAKEGRAAGSGGCNRFMGSFSRHGERLEFGRLASTMMACETSMDLERDFLRALSRARRWTITGSHLELRDADDQRIARFEARPGEDTTR